jgi:hypothetical protein
MTAHDAQGHPAITGESRISRRFQIWSHIWQGVTIKIIDFYVFNLEVNQV